VTSFSAAEMGKKEKGGIKGLQANDQGKRGRAGEGFVSVPLAHTLISQGGEDSRALPAGRKRKGALSSNLVRREKGVRRRRVQKEREEEKRLLLQPFGRKEKK